MRDIGARIQRYRLSRYASPYLPLLRRLRWALPIIGTWLFYAMIFGEHSLLRLWRLGQEDARNQSGLVTTLREVDRLEAQLKDPRARRDQAERALREHSGWVKKGEIQYRFGPARSDSLLD